MATPCPDAGNIDNSVSALILLISQNIDPMCEWTVAECLIAMPEGSGNATAPASARKRKAVVAVAGYNLQRTETPDSPLGSVLAVSGGYDTQKDSQPAESNRITGRIFVALQRK